MNYTDTFAFPVATIDGYSQHGLTKREYFAAMAMQGILSSDPVMKPPPGVMPSDHIANMAALMADALIATLESSE